MFNLIPWSKKETRPKMFYSPFKGVEEMMNRMFEDFWGGTDVGASMSRTVDFAPGFNILKKDGNYVVEASVPGYDKKDVNIEVKDDVLTITGEKKEEKEEKEKDYYYREFSSGTFKRSIRLPENTNAEDLKAKYKDGILEITIPALEEEEVESKAVKVPIE